MLSLTQGTTDMTSQATTFAFGNRKHFSMRCKWNESNANRHISIEECRDRIKELQVFQDPKDVSYDLQNCIVIFNDHGVPHLQFVRHNGQRSTPLRFTRTGWQAFSRDVMPQGGKFIEQLATMDIDGAKLATLSTCKMMYRNKYDTRTFRTLNIKEGSDVQRAVRFIHKNTSSAYTAIDNLALMNMLLDEPSLRGAHVLDFDVQDVGMRMRLSLVPLEEITELQKVYPAMEVRNSEVGKGAVSLFGMGLKPWCDNGAATWNTKNIHRFAHRWDPQRIIDGVRFARENILCDANEICEMHTRALSVAIDQLDLNHFLRENLKREGFNKTEIAHVIDDGLTHPTTPQLPCLAAGIDAITVIAQKYSSDRQFEMEVAASRIMKKGLEQFA